ncbi:MAG: oligosaccharide flippase family protein, partial [Flavobacteriales bacterium]|nr:oligosaccharide flippase family protein [Flavobacteriales bacterium]
MSKKIEIKINTLSNIQFIKSFLERKGGRIVFSSFFTKLISFIISVYIIRVIPKEEYGFLVYAITIIAFIAPFKGFGIYQGFLRYGSISTSQQLKKYYFNRILFKGLLFSSILIVILIAFSPFIISNIKNSFLYLVILSFQLVTLLIIDTISIYARIIGLNKLFADISNNNNLLLLAFA